MLFTTTFYNQLWSLKNTKSQEELFIQILDLYLSNFPIKNAYLMRYSPLGHLGQGIISFENNRFQFISHYVSDVKSVSIIEQALTECKAKFIEGIDYLKGMPSKYIEKSQSEKLIVVPLFSKNISFAYICGDELEENTKITSETLDQLTTFGNMVGELFIQQPKENEQKSPISRRELEVMRLVALGESTLEIAELINLSELTVKQYIKSAIKKLNARNRSEALTKLFKLNLI